MIKAKLLGATAAAESLAIEDVFSTYLYTGNSSTQTITNGIDLAGEGGLVWIKCRSSTADHILADTNRDMNFAGADLLFTNLSNGETANRANTIKPESTGFSLGSDTAFAGMNQSTFTYASWTFRKAPRFFDVVTYTGNGATGRQIAHDLGHEVGTLIIKSTDSTGSWIVYHRSIGTSQYLSLNSTGSAGNFSAINTVTSTYFVSDNQNTNGATYVAYLFAHDPLGPSGDGSDGLIACGSFTATGAEQEIDVGFEPQFVIRKVTNAAANWAMFDNMRGFSQTNTAYLNPNLSNAESNYTGADNDKPTSRGFKFTGVNGQTHIYIAIRRGPMREPTVGTQVFSPNAIGAVSVGTPVTTNFPVDLQIATWRGGTGGHYFMDRLRGVSSTTTEGGRSLESNSTAAETLISTFTRMWGNTGYQVDTSWSNSVSIFHNFRRAPGFFDVVAYKGKDTLGAAIPHNLGVAPELVIIKSRSALRDWMVALPLVGPDGREQSLSLNLTSGVRNERMFPSGGLLPDENNFYLAGENNVNTSSDNYIAYLFASLPGISKVGSYTGNGSSQTINCGFTTGARFILIKRTDSTGDWYVWDTARGIVSGNDPHLSLNTTAAEVTSDDTIDPDSTGFIVNQVAATNVNVNAATYIYLAIA